MTQIAMTGTADVPATTSGSIRTGSPLLNHTLFGIYVGLFVWGGLWLRNPKLRAMFPIAKAG